MALVIRFISRLNLELPSVLYKSNMYRTETFAKLFFLVSCTGLLMYVVLAFYTFHTAYTATSQVEKIRDRIQKHPSTETGYLEDRYRNDLKYILMWPSTKQERTIQENGQNIFIKHNCSEINCYLTFNKYILNGDYINFEAIVFNASAIMNWEENSLPQRRATRQKYIFYSADSADSGPMCNICAENFFNWTWTYKLNSDIRRPFIEVLDKNNVLVAPKEDVRWITHVQDPITSNHLKNNIHTRKLKTAVAIRLNKCKDKEIEFSIKLQEALKSKSLTLDIYGCTFLKCVPDDCLLKKDLYYFYLVNEESFAVDYVTAEIVKAYNMEAVPIVVGGADYHKFLPDGSYVNGHNKTVDYIAAIVEVLIDNPSLYLNYHDWRKYYVIRETTNFEGICDLCRDLNDRTKFKKRDAYKNFRKWWYSGSLYEKCTINPDPSVSLQTALKESDLETYYNKLHPKNNGPD